MAPRLHFFSLLLVSTLSGAQAAEEGGRFFENKAEGWFWYKDPKHIPSPPPAIAITSPTSATSPPPEPKAPAFSVSWLRKQLPVTLDLAIDNPTKENVEAYLYLQRVAMDKSQRYSDKAREVVALDPILDENNRVPLASFARPMFLRGIEDARSEALNHLATVAGIWMFYDSTCHFCQAQAATIEKLRQRHGFHVKYISIDGAGLPGLPDWVKDSGQAARLNLTITPTTVVVMPPNNYWIVSQGVMAEDQLAQRMILAADSHKVFPETVAKRLDGYGRGVLATESLEPASDEPADWVRLLKEKLGAKY